MDAHNQFKSTLGDADDEFKAIIRLIHEVDRICQQYHLSGDMENPYTTVQPQVIKFGFMLLYLLLFVMI